MKFDWASAGAVMSGLLLGIVGGLALHLKGVELAVFIALLALIGIAVAAAILYFKSRKQQAAQSTAAADPGGDSEIEGIVREADRRLAAANAGATLANLPLIFVIGDRGTAKTSTVVNSGIEPELLAGHLYQDNAIAPTRAANVWYARGTALVEAGGAVLGDPSNWMRLVKRLQPGKLKSLKGGAQSPRAVLLCVSVEAFSQSADAVAAACRYLQARLSDIAQTLGIRVPVYILFTKTDRLPFFTDFLGTFSNEEASQIFGVTVPIRPAQQSGVYAEDETRRLTGYFDNLFYSLCDKRTIYPPRENDPQKACGAYEFPRELRKTRDALVQFMVDVCRPSQLTTSPFLRGFYFSGVRPVTVNESAPLIASQAPQRQEAAGSTGATGMFRVGKQAELRAQQSVAQPAAASRRVPQWVFLGHLFNNVIFNDSAAMATSGSSVKVSALRRALLIAGSVVCLALIGLFLASYLGNRTLEQDALTAAQNINVKDASTNAVPSLGSLQQLETLRASLEKLDTYENEGAPYKLRWGLYQGSDMYPEVRRLYYAKFRALLFGQTHRGLLTYMQKLQSPPDPNADYPYPYDTLKGYLLTTSEYKRAADRALQDFLGGLLLARWSEGRQGEIGKDRMDLAKRQFDYYAKNLAAGNPYSSNADGDTVEHARVYLSGFKSVQRKYYGMLATVAKKGKATDFNQEFQGTAATVASTHQIPFAFTADGAKNMQIEIQRPNPVGEDWVLGPYKDKSDQTDELRAGIRDLYSKDYIKEWRTVLKTSHVVPYKNLKDAAEKLDKLTKSDAPLLELIWWTSRNTALPDLPDVNAAFQVPHQVEPASAVAYVPSAQAYNDALQNLQAAIAKAADAQASPDSVKAAQDAADAARAATKKTTAGFPVDREGQLDSAVGALMLEPITEAERMFKGLGAEELNSKGAGLCSSLGAITRKFPFNPTARDEATLDEIADIFKPKDGKLWVMYNGGLNKFVQCAGGDCKVVDKPTVSINPVFLHFFTQAVKFSRALYGDAGNDPAYHYTLIPQKSDQVESFDITVNGEQIKLDGGAKKDFVWPGGANRNFKLNLNLAGGTALGVQSRDGLWSVFRFFADADRTTFNGSSYDFFWNFRQGQGGAAPIVAGRPLAYAFTVDANGAPAVFSKEFLAGMKCVPTVAK